MSGRMSAWTGLLAAVWPLVVGCNLSKTWPGYGPAAPVRKLRLSGSQIPVEVLASWAEKCRKYRFDVEIVGRTDHNLMGIRELILGRSDLCCISRKVNEYEEIDFQRRHPGRKMVGTPVAMRAFAIYANPATPIHVISENQILGLFQGRLKYFSQMGFASQERIHLYGPPKDSPAGHVFSRFGSSLVEEPWWYECSTVEEVVRRVAEDPNGLGFAPIGYGRGLRVLAVRKKVRSKAYQPDPESILDNKYALGWGVYCYTNGPPRGPAKDLIDWLLSPPGRAVIRKTEPWVPVPPDSDR